MPPPTIKEGRERRAGSAALPAERREAMRTLMLSAALSVAALVGLAPAKADASWLSEYLHARFDPDYYSPAYSYAPAYDYPYSYAPAYEEDYVTPYYVPSYTYYVPSYSYWDYSYPTYWGSYAYPVYGRSWGGHHAYGDRYWGGGHWAGHREGGGHWTGYRGGHAGHVGRGGFAGHAGHVGHGGHGGHHR